MSKRDTSFSTKLLWLVLLIGFGCVEPYEPPVIENGVSLLVVDGSLNTEGKSIIKLSRSENLSETGPVPLELGAKVSFEDEGGTLYPLKEEGKGVYFLHQQTFNPTKQYRLKITTTRGKEYASEFVPIIKNPPVDSVSWAITADNGVQLYISTHDFENNTRYFRWTFEESWNYLSAYNSRFEWKDRIPILRSENIYQCYQTKPSGKIVIGSTSGLRENIISKLPLQYIQQRSEKIRFKYSILVKQYGITKEGHDYWLQLQRNTESLGTLFDPQPSQLTGNITCKSDLSEPALGFFTAGSATEKRIFISSEFLPRARTYITPFDGCSSDTLQIVNISLLSNKDLKNIFLLDPLPGGPLPTTAYSYTSAACADCRSAGGTTIKPGFWQ